MPKGRPLTYLERLERQLSERIEVVRRDIDRLETARAALLVVPRGFVCLGASRPRGHD